MKIISYLFGALWFLAAAACTDDKTLPAAVAGNEVTVNIGIRTYADDAALTQSESRISSVRVYAFDGDRLDKMKYAAVNADGTATVTMTVKPAASKTFYAVVNEPAAETPALDLADTPNGVEQAEYLISNYFAANVANLTPGDRSYVLPMFGSITESNLSANTESSPLQLTIPVTRSVARVDVYLKKAADNRQGLSVEPSASLLVDQSAAAGYLAPTLTASVKGPQREMNSDATTALTDAFGTRPLYSFYVPEQTCPGPDTRLKLTLKGVTFNGVPTDYNPVLLGETEMNVSDYLTKIERNKVYQIYGTILNTIITINVNVLDWDEEITVVEDGLPVESEANSYILRPGNNTVFIPVSQANLGIPGSIGDNDALTAELLWSDVKGAASGKGVAADAPISKIMLDGTGKNARLVVTSGARPGNALIAVKKGTEIVWSWHIWVTGYDPGKNARSGGGVTFMNCNLGAIYDNGMPMYDSRAFGMYYQWGRKDPFLYKIQPLYDADGATVARLSTPGQKSMQYAVNYPTTFIDHISSTGLDWNTNSDATLWGNTGPKSPYDPCPPGWRAPTQTDVAQLVPGMTYASPVYTNTTFGDFPKTGFITVGYNMDSSIDCITTATEGTDSQHCCALYMESSPLSVNMVNAADKYTGLVTRCVKDKGPR